MITFHCNIEGISSVLLISISPTQTIYDLKKQIYVEALQSLVVGRDPWISPSLRLMWIPNANDRLLWGIDEIITVWPEQPPGDRLHVFIALPGKVGSLTLVDSDTSAEGVKGVLDSDLVKEYESIFIKVKEWGAFVDDDIERNGIYKCDDETLIPGFVTKYERELDSKPGLALDNCIDNKEFQHEYFGPLKNRTSEDGPLEESPFESESHKRHAGRCEMIHLMYVATGFQRFWKAEFESTLEKLSLFFPYFIIHAGEVITAETPEDFVRMLLMGAAIVRFANTFLDAFKVAKDFVFFAIYVRDDGKVTRCALFQEPNGPEVRYKETIYWLDTSVGCAKFTRQLYNLRHMLERGKGIEDLNAKIEQLKDKIRQYNDEFHMRPFFTMGHRGSNDSKCAKRRRLDSDISDEGTEVSDEGSDVSDGARAGGESSADYAELRARGYEVKPGPKKGIEAVFQDAVSYSHRVSTGTPEEEINCEETFQEIQRARDAQPSEYPQAKAHYLADRFVPDTNDVVGHSPEDELRQGSCHVLTQQILEARSLKSAVASSRASHIFTSSASLTGTSSPTASSSTRTFA
ncbi:hypothetical protein BJV74DRAFT_797980 [Russula compacta]|nr:hypothetical protein BJV74DRAFT_797980 [Russula compacta]